MTRAMHIVTAVAAGAALVIAATACGGTSSSGGSGAAATSSSPDDQVLRIAWGADPPSLDPGLATDTTSSNVLLNIMDPLVKLGPDLQPVPNLAKSWDVKGSTVTFHLRSDGRWTDGTPVTAQDFAWSWKRTLSPSLAADYAYQFYGIKGAKAYNACQKKCAALRDKVGITAVDDHTLRVQLTSAEPWFVQQVAHHSFLAVPRKTVERWGSHWTDPKHIVTDGPFKLASWKHDASITLVKNHDWRDAKDVHLSRVEGRIIVDGVTRVQAFEAGEVDALDGGGLPPSEIPRLKSTDSYQRYPALGTYYYGFNVKQVPDVNQRRAMAMAIDRQAIIDNIAQADQLPATGFVPKGMPGFKTINQGYLPAHANLTAARALMAKVPHPKRSVTLYYNDSPGHREIAVAIQSMWKKLGIDTKIKGQEWAQYLDFLGPPPNSAVDTYRMGWIGDFVDAINFLELFTCDSGNNYTNWCSHRFDRIIDKARSTPDDQARYALYAKAESMLDGRTGAMPIIPIYWYTYVNLERPSIQKTFNINMLDQFDLSKVSFAS